MKSLAPALLTLILLALGPVALAQNAQFAGFAVEEPASEHQEAIHMARAEIAKLMAAGAPGVTVAVGVDDQIVWAEGFGYADVESRLAVTPQTKFRIGSVSKSMTSIAMGRLYEEGVLDLDVPIQTYLPEFPLKEKGTVTLRLLASHRAGVRHYLPDGSDNLIQVHYDDVVDALEIFENDPLIAVPGERYSYSSHGYNLLSAVLQEASGIEFLTLMQTTVWAPLKLTDTLADHTDYIIFQRAKPYVMRDGQLINAPYVDNSYKWAGGGFIATASDLVKFGFGVFNSGILEEETLALLLSPPLLPNGEIADQDYGLGWRAFDDARSWFGHTGGSVGGTTLFMINPEANVSVAVICNLTNCFRGDAKLREIGNYFLP